jgi:hypothetical protein
MIVRVNPKVFTESHQPNIDGTPGQAGCPHLLEDLIRAFLLLKFHLHHTSKGRRKKPYYISVDNKGPTRHDLLLLSSPWDTRCVIDARSSKRHDLLLLSSFGHSMQVDGTTSSTRHNRFPEHFRQPSNLPECLLPLDHAGTSQAATLDKAGAVKVLSMLRLADM